MILSKLPDFGTEWGALYRHNKAPQTYYFNRSDCIRNMTLVGGTKIQRKLDEGYKNVPLQSHEKDYLRMARIRKIQMQKKFNKY